MPLVAPGVRERQLVRMALAAGAAGLVGLVALVVVALWKGDRPEQRVAGDFVQEMFHAQGRRAYVRTTPVYRSLIFRAELQGLSEALTEVAGPDVVLEVLGSERTPGTQPQQSLVGYRGRGAVGPVEGVVTLLDAGEEGWLVAAMTFTFPDASDEDTADLDQLTETLNAQIAQRIQTAPRGSEAPQASETPQS